MTSKRLWVIGAAATAFWMLGAAGFAAGIRGGGGGGGFRGGGGGAFQGAPRTSFSEPRPSTHQFNPQAYRPPSYSSVPSFQPRQNAARTTPETRPGGVRPDTAARPAPGYSRPSEGQVRDFLNMHGESREVRPAAPATRPTPATRPAGTARPAERPHWQNLKPEQIGNVTSRWGKAIQGKDFQNWTSNHPQRPDMWHHWADNVHNHWNNAHVRNDWFRPSWWDRHVGPMPWWNYHHWWNRHPWYYWWGVPAWNSVCAWFAPWGWSTPCYYDYGPGGNVVYQDNSVWINGQEVATAGDFAKSASELATVQMPEQADPAQAEKMDWLPLGTFALSTNKEDTSPSFVVQLAVSKEGILSGTFYNRATDATYPVQGRVDKQTQRVAFTVGNKSDVVLETGLFNLTQDEAPVLAHHGADVVETYLLVRLKAPEDAEAPQTAP